MVKEKIQFLVDHLSVPLLIIDTIMVGDIEIKRDGVTIFRANSPKEVLKLLSKVENIAVILDGWYTQFHDEIERKWFRDSVRALANKNKLIIL